MVDTLKHGPACPRCGCEDSTVIKQPDQTKSVWWGSGTAECNHCGQRYCFKPDWQPPAAERRIPAVVCQCGETMRVTHTRKSVRYLRCDACGATTKAARKDN